MPRRSPTASSRCGPPTSPWPIPTAWLEGHGWDVDRWGGWPTADDLETVAPGRRCALWAHDHHALLVSHAGLEAAGVTRDTPDPSGGVIRRTPDGEPEGVLLESATRLVATVIPPMAQADLEAALIAVSLELLSLGIVEVHDPAGLAPDPDLDWSYPGLCAPVRDRPAATAGDGVVARRRARHRARRRPAQRRGARRTIRTAGRGSAG